MHLVFDIFQGIGIAAAVGIRPFLPSLVVGALAAADIQIDFAHSSYSFLQGALFLLIMVIGVVLVALTESIALIYNDFRWVLFVAFAAKLAFPDREVEG